MKGAYRLLILIITFIPYLRQFLCSCFKGITSRVYTQGFSFQKSQITELKQTVLFMELNEKNRAFQELDLSVNVAVFHSNICSSSCLKHL